jgi:hypothetical protein
MMAYYWCGERRARTRASVDGRDIDTDQRGCLLVNAALPTIGVVLLKMCKGSRRSDRVHLVIAMVVERHVHKRIIREPKDDIAHRVRLGCGQLVKDAFDSSLVLIRRLSRLRCVPSNQPLLHGVAPFTDAGAYGN